MNDTERDLERRLKSEQEELFKFHRINERLMTECDIYHLERDQWRECAERLAGWIRGRTSFDESAVDALDEFERLKETK